MAKFTSHIESEKKRKKKTGDIVLSVLDDPNKRPAIDSCVKLFQAQLADGWKLSRNDASSPPLSSELQEILAQGIYELVDSMGRAEDPASAEKIYSTLPKKLRKHPTGTPHAATELSKSWVDIFTGTAALMLKEKISSSEQMQQYAGDKEDATLNLLGAVIRRAVDVAREQDISLEGVSWTFLK